jgi:3-oxoadipate enol-lactonase
MPRALVNGTELHYEDTGPRDAPVVLFSHGLLFSTELFRRQIDELSRSFRCVAYDHRGQGKSADSRESSVSMELLFQDAAGLIEHLRLAAVHFVGLSMGGFVGMRLAARRPDLVRSLVLLETSADREPAENIFKYRALSMVARGLGVAVVIDRVMPILFGASSLGDPSRRGEVAAWRALLLGNRRSVWRAVNGVIDRVAILPELERVACPTTVMVGDEDTATPPERAERIHRAITGARLRRIAKAGHSSTLEQPEVVTRAIEEHLQRSIAAAGKTLSQ